MLCGEKLSYPQDAIEIVVCLVGRSIFHEIRLCVHFIGYIRETSARQRANETLRFERVAVIRNRNGMTPEFAVSAAGSESSEVDTCLSVFPIPRPLRSQIKFKEALKKL